MAQVFQVQVFVAGNEFVAVNVKRVYEKIQKVVRHGTVVDEAADVSYFTLLYFLLELGHKVGTAGGVVN